MQLHANISPSYSSFVHVEDTLLMFLSENRKHGKFNELKTIWCLLEDNVIPKFDTQSDKCVQFGCKFNDPAAPEDLKILLCF